MSSESVPTTAKMPIDTALVITQHERTPSRSRQDPTIDVTEPCARTPSRMPSREQRNTSTPSEMHQHVERPCCRGGTAEVLEEGDISDARLVSGGLDRGTSSGTISPSPMISAIGGSPSAATAVSSSLHPNMTLPSRINRSQSFQTPCRTTQVVTGGADLENNESEWAAFGLERRTRCDVRSAERRPAFQTPARDERSCAICLSPLASQRRSDERDRQQQHQHEQSTRGDAYTIKMCRHIFHRGCLVENRRAGNAGCPCCRGTLERGLTPEVTTAEREALAAARRQDDQREAIRNAASRARLALARSLRRREESLAREAAEAASAAGEDENHSSRALLST